MDAPAGPGDSPSDVPYPTDHEPLVAEPAATHGAGAPSTPPLAGLVAVVALLGVVLALTCTAGAFVLVQAKVAGEVRKSGREVARLQTGRDAEITLDGVFDELEGFLLSLHADAFSFPEVLPELAPDDPWGRPIRYQRLDADRVRLESDGPDRRPHTPDDIARVVFAG